MDALRTAPAVAALVAAVLYLSCSHSPSPGSESAEPDWSSISIGAMPPGTSWYVFGATLATLLEQELPAGTRVEVVARGGAIGNPILVDRGTETIALAQAATAAWAMEGDEQAYDGKKYTNIRALAGGLNAVWQMALLRESYIERTGNDTLEKALLSDEPIRIVMKPNGSVVPILADRILAAVGTSRKEIIAKGGEIIQVSANQIPTLLRDGRADLYFESAIRGHPTITEVTATEKMRFLDIPAGVLAALSGPGLTPLPMPQWFEGQTGPTDGVDMGTVLIAHKDLPDDLAYAITRAVCEHKDEMASSHKAWLDFEPRLAGQLDKTGIPLHPGAERYYREQGWYP